KHQRCVRPSPAFVHSDLAGIDSESRHSTVTGVGRMSQSSASSAPVAVDGSDGHSFPRYQVADQIRERIVMGEYPPGMRLIERTLATELGVSRIPVRDALNLLRGEGFVSSNPNRGMVVTTLT